MTSVIYKICPKSLWHEAESAGEFAGAGIDLADGYIHFSTAEQTPETARLYFSNTPDLVIVAVDSRPLGAALKWEESRGGQLFPHLYGVLPTSAALWVKSLPMDDEGAPRVPSLDADTGS
ncbi:FIG005495: hypothetical protein [Candidatus Phaeomarinobacter ectocarpi]|uniref:Dihydroorotate dehydrogenase n=1 Tax=Candidatus Phaeomarinibacter ectocarpi TaxID=1458461 RepID=X5M9E8_9HYPH|nr:DUF952 domain-containing protein [Candidatus Phaeomarinobacter ectocarpi]CDO60148.1 FIG005495: hypothetical protein [Candidatus Phaeomarinobacter ectocarpi]